MKWNNLDANDYRVVKTSHWRFIENYESLEARAGVFIFISIDNEVRYIGEASSYRMLEEISNAIEEGRDFGTVSVKALYTDSDAKAKSLERYLIKKYDPPNNLT
jgi:excinuclease UvrABC nuclease subunit